MCCCSHPQFTDGLINFLDFLLVEKQLLDINETIYGYPNRTVLQSILYRQNMGKSVKEMVERVAEYLISIGADPELKSLAGLNAYEIADLRGYTLPPKQVL